MINISSNEIGPEAVRKKLLAHENILVVDVREPWEYAEGHIHGAVNIPVSRFAISPPEFPKENLIVTVCEHGVRSEAVRKILAKKSYDVRSMEGGMSCWDFERERN